MVQTNVIKTKWVQRIVIGYVFLMIVGLVLFRSSNGSGQLFELSFNNYALISCAALLVNLFFASVVLTRQSEFKSSEASWFFLFLGAIIVFSACEMLQRLSVTQNGALFWAQLAGIGPAFEPIGLFLFSLFYVSRRTVDVAFISLVLLGGGVLLFFHGNGGLVFQTSSNAIKLYPWGYNNDVGNAFALNAVWSLGLVLIALVMLLRFRHRTQNQILKRQSMLFAVAFSFPLVGALVFDIVGPAIGFSVPPLHDVFTLGTAGLMLYGLRHYRLFDVTTESMAGDILSTMSESVIVTDSNLRIELMNQSAESIFGKSFKHVGGKSMIDLFETDQAEHIKTAIRNVTLTKKKYIIGNYVIHTGPNPTYIRVTAAKITEEHGVSGYVFAIADVNELQQSYMALEHAKTNVDRKVAQRTKELRTAQDRLAETDMIKTEFVILASHNLRTPLTTIKGNLEFLTETKLDKKQKKFVTALGESTERLYNLVEELLTISQIEAGDDIEMVDTTLDQVLEPLIGEAKTLADTTNNIFTFILPNKTYKLHVNVARLQTAIHNLLDNAFKFTKLGHVQLVASANKDHIIIKIIDTGIGITADEVPKLFTKFHQSSSHGKKMTYDYSGEGIGLYLAKLIVEENKGRINVSSEPNVGSTFTVTLPRH